MLKAQSIKTGKYVAIKCMKNHFDTIEQVIKTQSKSLGEQFERDLGFEKTLASPTGD